MVKDGGIRVKKAFSKLEIDKYCKLAYDYLDKQTGEIIGDINEEEKEILNIEFEEETVLMGNCFDGFFEQINVCRFGNYLSVELQKLGDYDGYYKDWSMKKYMQTMAEIYNSVDDVVVSNYEYDDEPDGRAFYIAFLFDIDEFKYYESVYKYCHNFCQQIEKLVEQKIKGCYWQKEFETDEMLFCHMYLTPFFRRMGFENVIFNHGNKEFGKDYILVITNIFGEKEYYGVQVKAGNMSGAATSDIMEISNQINMAFKVPYKLVNGTEIYISKMIIAISGNYTDNAKMIIENDIEKYKSTNIVFLSKKELENSSIMQ